MSKILLISMYLILTVTAKTTLAQNNNYYKPILDNGYTWISLSEPLSIATDNRYNYLVSLLGNQKLKKFTKNNYGPIDCEKDISDLDVSLAKANKIDLDFMVKKLDEFYDNKENLIIPILGAYCYSIKKLAGYNESDLESYRQELLSFSKEQSEQ